MSNLEGNNGEQDHSLLVQRLHEASSEGNLEEIQRVLNQGIDVDALDDGKSPLQRACHKNQVEAARFLLERGANVNPADDWITPLYIAVVESNTSLVQLLVENRADTNVVCPEGITPLLWQVYNNPDVEIARLLLQYGADANFLFDGGFTSLHVAVNKRSVSWVQLLAENRADANVVSRTGITPFWLACGQHVCENSENEDLEIVRLLLQHGADANVPCNGSTPLHVAAMGKSLPLVELLLENEADASLVDGQNRTPLEVACLGEPVPRVLSLLMHAHPAAAQTLSLDELKRLAVHFPEALNHVLGPQCDNRQREKVSDAITMLKRMSHVVLTASLDARGHATYHLTFNMNDSFRGDIDLQTCCWKAIVELCSAETTEAKAEPDIVNLMAYGEVIDQGCFIASTLQTILADAVGTGRSGKKS